jgi:hypothetical protein
MNVKAGVHGLNIVKQLNLFVIVGRAKRYRMLSDEHTSLSRSEGIETVSVQSTLKSEGVTTHCIKKTISNATHA